MNFVRFVAEKAGKKELASNPGLIKTLPEKQIRQLARTIFS
jgi:hypothetical protein